MIQIDMPMPDGCSECRFETARGFCKAMPDSFCGYTNDEGRPAWCPLKAQENLKQKMWNALYAEEDKLEKKFAGTEDDAWFFIYRPWLQRGFDIAIKVIVEQDGM